MFNWFKKQPEAIAVPVPTWAVPSPEFEVSTYNGLSKTPSYKDSLPSKEGEIADASYTVGITQAGETQLRINNNMHGATTLTMNSHSVALLIKQLAVTIEDTYDVDVDKI